MAKQTKEPVVKEIPIKDIDRSRNHRIKESGDKARIESLAAAIKVGGQLQAVRVYERGPDQQSGKHKESYILGFGARRCEALLALGRNTVRAAIHPPASDREIEQARAIENIHRKDISPLEEVNAVASMLDAIKKDKTFANDPYEETATQLGRSVTWVKDRDYLHRLSKSVRAFVSRAGLPAGHLRELAKVGDSDDQLRLACEAANAPAWAFEASGSMISDAAKEAQQRFFEKLTDGGMDRWTLSRLKRDVEMLKHSLKVVPWEYEELIEYGKVKLPACAACPHNSETDHTLFGMESDSTNPKGYCLNASCFESKRNAAEAAKHALLSKISRRRDQTPTAIKKATPKWLKKTTAVGYVSRELKKAAASPAKTDTQESKRDVSRGRPLTDFEKAIQAFAKSQQAWQEAAYQAVLDGINADPAYRVGWCVLIATEAFQQQENWEIADINGYSNQPCVTEPTLAKLSAKVKKAIDLAMKGTRTAWIELAGWNEQIDPDYRNDVGWLHPEALRLLAGHVGAELPDMPQWKAPSKPDATAASK